MQDRYRARRWWLVGMVVCVAVMGVVGEAAGKVVKGKIDSIRAKSVLKDERDLALIRQFVAERFNAMLRASRTSAVMEAKRDLLETAKSTSRGTAAWKTYAETFALAVQGEYERVLAGAEKVADKDVAKSIKLTTVVVLAETDSPLLIGDLLKLLRSQDKQVRYWAAKGLAKPEVRAYVGDCRNDDATKVRDGLSEALAGEDGAAVVGAIAEAAGGLVGCDGGVELLLACVDKRTRAYQDWSVTNEWVDVAIMASILKAVNAEAIEDESEKRTALVKGAAKLFSAGHWRYVKGISYQNEEGEVVVLFGRGGEVRDELQLLLIVGEQLFHQVLPERLGRPEARYRRALLKGNVAELNRALQRLLGEVNGSFEILPEGTENDPLVEVGDPPSEVVERLINLNRARMKVID